MRTVVGWSIHVVTLPYSAPVRWAHHSETGNQVLLLCLHSHAGAIGIGEVTLKPGWYGASKNALIATLRDVFLPMLTGLDVSDPTAFHRAAQLIPENQVGRAVVDNALWDLHAAETGSPLWRQWEGESSAEVCWLVSRRSGGSMVEDAAHAVAEYGITTLKMKGGQGVEFDLGMLADVQRAVGAATRLFVDANWHYSAQEAPHYIDALARAGIVAVEDPYSLAPDRWFEKVQRESPIPLIVDFSAGSLRDARLFHERGVQALSLKPARIGFTECLAMAAFAREAGIRVHVGFGGESSVGSFSSLQFASTLWCAGQWMPAETVFFLQNREDLLTRPLAVVDGRVQCPEVNSCSELIDWNKLARLDEVGERGTL